MALQHKSIDATVTDRLTAEYEAVPAHVSSCPECDSAVADGQGLLGCVGCGWHGFVA